MGHIPHLDQLALVVGVGVIVALLLSRLHLPTVAGLLVAGALGGPYGLGFVTNPEQIQSLAEVGVVFLLFSVGLEFSLARLKFIAKQVVVGGSLQVGLTIGCVLLAWLAAGGSASRGVFMGFLFALSSTAIVLRAFTERGELDAPHGRMVVGVLIFQDLCVVPMMLIVPLLATQGQPAAGQAGLVSVLAKAVVVVALVLAIGRLGVPRFFGWIDKSHSRELFVLAVAGVCIGSAWLTAQASLSLALGAFLAGMMVADTEFRERAIGEILPLRDVFSSLFFMSMGMLFDVRVLVQHPVAVALLLAGLVVGKGFVATVAALAMRFPARVAWLVGVGLAQFGEFGFVLAAMGERTGLLDLETARTLLAAGALSMFITPLAVRVAPHISAGERLLRPLERLLGARGIDEPAPEHQGLSGHVIIGGYGTGGRLLSQALAGTQTPRLALDLDADRVREARAAGEAVYYGDVTSSEALANARLPEARALVLLISDYEAAHRALAAARKLAPHVPVLIRARGMGDATLFKGVSPENIVVERLEAGIEMTARVMRRVGIPGNVIAEAVRKARDETQKSERKVTLPRPRLGQVDELADLKVESAVLRPGAHAVGKSMADLNLQGQSGALVVAIRRQSALVDHPSPTQPLQEGDTLFLAGSGGAIRRAILILEAGTFEEERRRSPTNLE